MATEFSVIGSQLSLKHQTRSNRAIMLLTMQNRQLEISCSHLPRNPFANKPQSKNNIIKRGQEALSYKRLTLKLFLDCCWHFSNVNNNLKNVTVTRYVKSPVILTDIISAIPFVHSINLLDMSRCSATGGLWKGNVIPQIKKDCGFWSSASCYLSEII